MSQSWTDKSETWKLSNTKIYDGNVLQVKITAVVS